LGVTVDMTSRTMGVRTRRFAMYVDDGEVQFSCFLVVLKNLRFAGHNLCQISHILPILDDHTKNIYSGVAGQVCNGGDGGNPKHGIWISKSSVALTLASLTSWFA